MAEGRERKAEGPEGKGCVLSSPPPHPNPNPLPQERGYVVHLLGAMAALIGLCSPVWAHGDEAEELGHHWELAAYIGEVRLQLALMAGITCAIAAWLLAARYLRKRGARG